MIKIFEDKKAKIKFLKFSFSIIFIVFLIFLLKFILAQIIIYQENANQVWCEGNWALGQPCANTYDGYWDTFGTVAIAGENVTVHFNYTKLQNINNITWQVSEIQSTSRFVNNITLNSSCYINSPIQLYAISTANSPIGTYGVLWYCINQTLNDSILLRRFDGSSIGIEEEELIFDISSNPTINVSLIFPANNSNFANLNQTFSGNAISFSNFNLSSMQIYLWNSSNYLFPVEAGSRSIFQENANNSWCVGYWDTTQNCTNTYDGYSIGV